MGHKILVHHKSDLCVAFTSAVFLFCAVLGCCEAGVPTEYRQFFDLSLQQRHEKFRTLPVEKQLDLYLYAVDRHPPDFGYADDIASKGESTIPLVIKKLKSEKSEYNQNALIRIFVSLSAKGNLRGKQDVIDLIRQVVLSMKNKVAQEEGRELLESIEHQT